MNNDWTLRTIGVATPRHNEYVTVYELCHGEKDVATIQGPIALRLLACITALQDMSDEDLAIVNEFSNPTERLMKLKEFI